MKKQNSITNKIWIVILSIASLLYVYPIVMILLTSLKKETAISTSSAFELPTAESFNGLQNYVDAIASKGFLRSLGYSLFITLTSVIAILICCAMCALFITRVAGKLS